VLAFWYLYILYTFKNVKNSQRDLYTVIPARRRSSVLLTARPSLLRFPSFAWYVLRGYLTDNGGSVLRPGLAVQSSATL